MYTQIYDNNSLALASTMMIPIINYLRVHTPHKLLRLGLTAAMFFTTVSVIGSYSRGGIIAMAAMLLFLWAKSRTKVATMALAIFVGVIGISFMPEKYTDRISTIKTATEDESFKGRLDAWEVAWRTALDRPLGAGFDGPRQRVIWDKYLPDRWARASHSIYFMVLGEHGFIGLGIWLALIYAAWRNLVWVVKRTRGLDEMLWAKDLAQAIQVSMIGFMVGGAALPMAYYDGFFALLAIGTVLRLLVQREIGVAPRRVWWPKPATPSPAGTAPQVARTASP
jgi:probable O-glycosylation ligase (exosortase A-associated)